MTNDFPPPKAFRRSVKAEKDSKPHHISLTPKSAIAIQPPKKVRETSLPCGAQAESEHHDLGD